MILLKSIYIYFREGLYDSMVFLPRSIISFSPFYLFFFVLWICFYLIKQLFETELNDVCDVWYTDDWYMIR